MVEAWQKREMEWQDFLEELERKLTHDDEGEFLPDLAILERCQELLAVVIGEMKGDGKTIAQVNIHATNGVLNDFARTSIEAMAMKRRLIEKLLVAGFHDVESEHLRQRVHEQERLYGGHQAMDEVELD